MVVISDSSIITGLLAIDRLSIIHKLFDTVLISKTVRKELKSLSQFGYDIVQLQQEWLIVSKVKNKAFVEKLTRQLDLGEAESIALSVERKADYLLIDEKKGRKIAAEHGLKVIGLLGILIQARKNQLIPMLKPELDKLSSKIEFRLSKDLINYALKIVNE